MKWNTIKKKNDAAAGDDDDERVNIEEKRLTELTVKIVIRTIFMCINND